MDENLAADDKIEKDGAVLYIPKTNSWMLFGMEVGYAEGKLQSGFTFTNPNETGRCGCGEFLRRAALISTPDSRYNKGPREEASQLIFLE